MANLKELTFVLPHNVSLFTPSKEGELAPGEKIKNRLNELEDSPKNKDEENRAKNRYYAKVISQKDGDEFYIYSSYLGRWDIEAQGIDRYLEKNPYLVSYKEKAFMFSEGVLYFKIYEYLNEEELANSAMLLEELKKTYPIPPKEEALKLIDTKIAHLIRHDFIVPQAREKLGYMVYLLLIAFDMQSEMSGGKPPYSKISYISLVDKDTGESFLVFSPAIAGVLGLTKHYIQLAGGGAGAGIEDVKQKIDEVFNNSITTKTTEFENALTTKTTEFENALTTKTTEFTDTLNSKVAEATSSFDTQMTEFTSAVDEQISNSLAGIDAKIDGVTNELKNTINRVVSSAITDLSANQLNIIANKVLEVLQINNATPINYSPTMAKVGIYQNGEPIDLGLKSTTDGTLAGEISLNGTYTIMIKDK